MNIANNLLWLLSYKILPEGTSVARGKNKIKNKKILKQTMKNKISIFLAYDIPPATHECPHKISAKSVQPFCWLYTAYI